MTVSILILIIAALAILQPTPTRQKAALICAAAYLTHDALFSELTGLEYYASAAEFDACIIFVTANMAHPCRLIKDIQRVCAISIALNVVGWVMYMLYVPPALYDFSFTLLYLWTIIILLRKDRQYIGDYTLDNWANYFRLNHTTGGGGNYYS